MRDLEPYYQYFADFIVDAISEPWQKAWFAVEMEEDYESYQGLYVADGGSEEKSFVLDDDMQSKVREFWEEFRKGGGDVWYSFTFTLFPDGKFELDFEYEPPSE